MARQYVDVLLLLALCASGVRGSPTDATGTTTEPDNSTTLVDTTSIDPTVKTTEPDTTPVDTIENDPTVNTTEAGTTAGPTVTACDVENCATCNQSNAMECDTCKAGYSRHNATLCIACDVENCATCNQSNVMECDTCKAGYSRYNATLCIECEVDNCKMCHPNNKQQCTECEDDHYRYNDATRCSECDTKCKTCIAEQGKDDCTKDNCDIAKLEECINTAVRAAGSLALLACLVASRRLL